MTKFLLVTIIVIPFVSLGQNSLSDSLRIELGHPQILKISDQQVEYSDSLRSNLYTFFGNHRFSMNGPQYFLILREDSTFTWDAWYGSDSYISSGFYAETNDTLFLFGNTEQTDAFAEVFEAANPDWPWFNKIEVKKRFEILQTDSTGRISSLKLIEAKTDKDGKVY